MEKTTHTKADCLTVCQMAKKYDKDSEKMLQAMKRVHGRKVTIPGKPLKPAVIFDLRTHKKNSYKTGGEPVCELIILEEYKNMFETKTR